MADFLNNARRLWAKHRFVRVATLILWVTGGFIFSQFIVALLVSLVFSFGNITTVNQVMLTFITSALMYIVGLLIVVGIPMRLRGWSLPALKRRLGLNNRPDFMYVIFAVLGFGAYALLSMFLLWAADALLPWFNPLQEQVLGFNAFGSWFEVAIGFLAFVVCAPLAEELFFRGFLFGGLRKYLNFGVAALIVSLLFGLAHGQLNVAIDTFALSLLLCLVYEASGSLWPSIALHVIKNAIAFSFLLQASSIQ